MQLVIVLQMLPSNSEIRHHSIIIIIRYRSNASTIHYHTAQDM